MALESNIGPVGYLRAHVEWSSASLVDLRVPRGIPYLTNLLRRQTINNESKSSRSLSEQPSSSTQHQKMYAKQSDGILLVRYYERQSSICCLVLTYS